MNGKIKLTNNVIGEYYLSQANEQLFGQTKAGFTKTDGAQRQLTITEQLSQVVNSRTDGTINHPIHRRIKVSLGIARFCIDRNITDEALIDARKIAFHHDN